jgi:hypothetical protein
MLLPLLVPAREIAEQGRFRDMQPLLRSDREIELFGDGNEVP